MTVNLEAQAPPRPPAFFDAHCDTVMKVLDEGADFVRGGGGAHVTFPAMLEAGIRAQLFACFVLTERHPGEEAERAESMATSQYQASRSSPGKGSGSVAHPPILCQ